MCVFSNGLTKKFRQYIFAFQFPVGFGYGVAKAATDHMTKMVALGKQILTLVISCDTFAIGFGCVQKNQNFFFAQN